MTRIRGGPAPSREDLLASDRVEELARSELERTRTQAARWRDGLAALIALISASVIVKGRDTAKDLSGSWKYAVGAMLLLALLCALAAAVLAMIAAYGPTPRSSPVGPLAGLNARRLREDRRAAERAGRQLRAATGLTMATALFLIATVALTYLAPSGPTDSGCIQLQLKGGSSTVLTANRQSLQITGSSVAVAPC